MDDLVRKPRRALVLPGAGARGAYQVGVLKAISGLMPKGSANPFPIICGTSAGAINAAVLASRAPRFERAVAELEKVWGNFRAEQVFRTDTWVMVRSSLHWLAALTLGGLGVRNPSSLLDNEPLRELLKRRIPFNAIARSIERGHLDALAITASAYTSARSVTFYQSRDAIEPWLRRRRIGRPARIGVEHLMASAAVPFIFPPVRLGGEYYGDGSMRNRSPLSSAIHLGADRILVIGGRDETSDPEPAVGDRVPFPTIGQLGGYILDTLFLDSLHLDLETISRINQLLDEANARTVTASGGELRRLHTLIVLPDTDMRKIAARHATELPLPVRLLLNGLGAMNQHGMQLVSYMLFEAGYTRELIELGFTDAMGMEDQLRAFLSDEPIEPAVVETSTQQI